MNWKGHMALGALIFSLTYIMFLLLDSSFQWMLYQNALIPIPTLIIALPVAMYGAIAPDVDIRTSYAYVVSVCLIIAVIWYLVINQRISAFTGLLGLSGASIGLLIPKHRGIFHSLAFALLFAGAMGLIFMDWRLGMLTFGSCASHLVGDR